MVDVSAKGETVRQATAQGWLTMTADTLQRFREGSLDKGDAAAVARVAGISAAKRTSDLIPLCHPLRLSGVTIDIHPHPPEKIEVRATVRCTERTGVEMEALTSVSVACLTLYDMLKALDKGITIGPIQLLEKTGGKSGDWSRGGER
ncbi:MAG: cyclic pyranopterin monophosphate synthase MoaC [Candidatus Eremiobacteraeota bacterium]|nr:cyclic pyranopterin monophosphate synthase MoaC [Candidatus Eremiobacteraeota bacterium]